MKLYLYNGLDGNGKATYQAIEISNSEADAWVQVDFEKQRKEKGDKATPRTAQQIADEMNKNEYNSDRRYRYMLDPTQIIKAEDGYEGAEEASRAELIADDTYNPEIQQLVDEEERESQERAEMWLSVLSRKQKKRLTEYVINRKTLTEIATAEGLHPSTIDESIKSAIKKINKKFPKHPEK